MKPLLLACLSASLLGVSVLAAAETTPPRRVAFIFDDGPTVEQSARFHALLAAEKVHVTFAHVGRNVLAHPELTRAAAEGGHEILNHSFTHAHLKQLDDAGVEREASQTSAAIQSATGRPPAWFWAPFLEWDERIAAVVRSTGLEHFPTGRFHFISTDDWNRETDAATILRRATTDVRDRTVILCHEWREETLAQLPAILAELRRQGCEFVTFSELAAL